MKEIVPEFSTVHNPLDVTGFVVVDGILLRRALAVVTEDQGLDFILCLTDPPRIEPEDVDSLTEQYGQLRDIMTESKIPVVIVSNTSIDITFFGRSIIERFILHFIGGIEHGMSALGKALWWYEKYQSLLTEAAEKETYSVVQLLTETSAVSINM